jgi:hypothetical protein
MSLIGVPHQPRERNRGSYQATRMLEYVQNLGLFRLRIPVASPKSLAIVIHLTSSSSFYSCHLAVMGMP